MELLKESLDDMPAELNQQGELTAGLVMLLKKSIASEKKATGEILRLQEDKAKLCHEIDLLKEKNAGWKKLHENSSSSMKMLQALVMEQKEELAKLRIEHPAAVKVRNAAVEQMMKARIEKSFFFCSCVSSFASGVSSHVSCSPRGMNRTMLTMR